MFWFVWTPCKMQMKISEIPIINEQNIKCVKDGVFEAIALAGRNYDNTKRVITFVTSKKYIRSALKLNPECIICNETVLEDLSRVYSGGICVTENPRVVLFEIHKILASARPPQSLSLISGTASIHPTAHIAKNNVIIGENVIIGPNVIIKEGVIIDDNVTIMDNCVIGADAFYYYGEGDQKKLVSSTGRVIIESNVTLHTNVIVEKGVIGGDTKISKNCKIDQMSLVGHDVHMGENCVLTGRVTLAGWVKVGKNTFMGISSTVAPAVTIGDDCYIGIGSVVISDVKKSTKVFGNPATRVKL